MKTMTECRYKNIIFMRCSWMSIDNETHVVDKKITFFPMSKSRLEDTISWKCMNHAKGCIHHSWHWTRFSQVLTRMSGNLIVLTWQSFSSRYDSFKLVKIARVNCNRCDLIKDVVVKVGCCKFHIGKFEVLSLKLEVRNFGVSSLPSLLSLHLHCLTSPRVSELEGRRKTVKGQEERDGIKLTFCNWNLLTFQKFDLEFQTSSFDFEFRRSKLEVNHLLRRPLSPHIFAHPPELTIFFFFFFLFFLFLNGVFFWWAGLMLFSVCFVFFSDKKIEESILELRTSNSEVSPKFCKILDAQRDDASSPSRRWELTWCTIAFVFLGRHGRVQESISLPSCWTWETLGHYAISNVKTGHERSLPLWSRRDNDIYFSWRSRHMLCWNHVMNRWNRIGMM